MTCRAQLIGQDPDPLRHAVQDFIDALRERRYLFWRRILGYHAREPVYLWNGGWGHDD